MLHRIKMDEESSSDDTGSLVSSSGASTAPSSSDLEKLSLGSGPSMSSVYSSSNTDEPDSSSRPPSRPGSLFHRRKTSQSGSSDGGAGKRKREREDHMCRWLQAGNVIYKSVGLGLMDLTVGMKVVESAREKGVGTHVPGF